MDFEGIGILLLLMLSGTLLWHLSGGDTPRKS